MGAIGSGIEQLIEVGWKLQDWSAYHTWTKRVTAFLRMALGPEVAKEFLAVGSAGPSLWEHDRATQIGLLDGLVALRADAEAEEERSSSNSAPAGTRVSVPVSKRVFVVHGHDHGTKEAVARHLERLGLDVVILHEKANEGRTVIEKIEAHSDVGFAVVLLTPDDIGAPAKEGTTAQPRARQNVVLELGYFLGKLKRNRVCALYTPGVEIPSDYQGVLYIELDDKGAWRTQLAQELSNARLPINVAGLLNS